MKCFLLDTSHIGEAIGRVSVVRDRVQQLHRQGTVFGTCGPVLCELLVGVVTRKDALQARKRLDGLLKVVRVWPIEVPICELVCRSLPRAAKAGRALSQVDIMLAALSRNLNATLLTTDQDFQALPDIQTENWLAE